MAYEAKPDTGSLFKNDRKTSDTHPQAKGSALIGGIEYWVDAWTNEDRNGNKYQSLKFKVKEARSADNYSSPSPAHHNDLDDDVPF